VALEQPEPAILQAAQRGDEQAFASIFEAYRRPIHNYVRRTLNDDLVAEDVTQEVFIRAHRSLARFDGRSLFTSWLFQIAKNRIVDEHRVRARRPPSLRESQTVEVVSRSDEPSMETREIVAAIWQAVAALDDRLKNPLLLRDVSGLSYREIAEILGIEIGNVKWRIFKAREAIQTDLALAGLTPTTNRGEHTLASSAAAIAAAS
jgi:RNA polymerase sigma-70 factor, ECF subfamily